MLKVRIKTQPKDVETLRMTLKDFFKLYFKNLYNEMNSLLSDYHSIQEHSNRSKIIEFVNKKQKDFDLLQVFVVGAFLSDKLNLLHFKSEDALRASNKIVEIADFLAILYQNMKLSFVPNPSFELCLQTHIDASKLISLIPKPISKEISSKDFEEIHRMMRIYILKENIRNYVIENGILTIKSEYFDFELALCGDFANPTWHLIKVKSFLQNKTVEDQIQRRLPDIESIVNFINFFNIRKKANDIFGQLENRTGFYQSFAGTIKGFDLQGSLNGNNFLCKVNYKNLFKEFLNPEINEIHQFIDMHAEKPIPSTDFALDYGKEFRADIFGQNITFIRNGLFFCLCKERNICYFGKNMQICGLKFLKMTLKYDGFKIHGHISNCSNQNYQFGSGNKFNNNFVNKAENVVHSRVSIFSTGLAAFVNYIEQKFSYFELIWKINDLSFTADIEESLICSFFSIDSQLKLYTIDDNEIYYNGGLTKEEKITALANKIRLLEIQFVLKDSPNICESKPGEKLSLLISDIKVVISNTFKTNLKFLTDDCQKFNINQALQYVINFGSFYQHNLYPDVHLVSKISFCFIDLFDETVSITIQDGFFNISGPHTIKAAKINNTFNVDETKMFLLLYKLWIANRFMALKRQLNAPNRIHDRNDQIDLGDNRSIFLTLEGLKYQSNDPKKDMEINRALNTERSIWKYFR